ncbi:Pre-mRNA-splicing factor dre4 [Schizosaccharomyces pombe]
MSQPLPPGWTEHKAPSGIPYYWNAELKKSTYQRPSFIEKNHSSSATASQASLAFNTSEKLFVNENAEERKNFRDLRKQLPDRPKFKKRIPNNDSWVVVFTKKNRYFFHNLKSHESYWEPPLEISKDLKILRLPIRKQISKDSSQSQNVDSGKTNHEEIHESRHLQTEIEEPSGLEESSEESVLYSEEFYEKSDEEEDEEKSHSAEELEFGEEDIMYQLQQLDDETVSYDIQEQATNLSTDDARRVFTELLKDKNIGAYQPWELVYPKLLDDDRFYVLDSGERRKEVFEEYCKSVASTKKITRRKNTLSDFWALLHSLPSTLLWPQFKRKYRKSSTLQIPGYSERDFEKLFREFQILRKQPMQDKLLNFKKLCKSKTVDPKNPDEFTESILNDTRYAVLTREELDSLACSSN